MKVSRRGTSGGVSTPQLHQRLKGANLIEVHLENADLSKANLEDAELFEAHLENADLSVAKLEHADLTGANLEHADLHWAHLEHARFFRANLEHAKLSGANLERACLGEANLEHAWLFRANLEHADLRDANLEHADVIGANLKNADLSGAHLENANLRWADMTDANVAGLSYLGLGSPSQERAPLPRWAQRMWDWLRTNPIPYRRRMMRGRYQGIRGLSSCYGNRIFVRDASDQDYLDTVEAQWDSRLRRFWFWIWGLTDYGRSMMSIVAFASILIFGFGFVYSHSPGILKAPGRCPTPFTPYYFSIVTYTTLGFGDVRPNNLAGEILVSIEVILGYVTLGLLLAVLGDKVARRS